MEKNNSHLAGEYFVAAELYRRGYSIGMTIGNAKAIDLFASKEGQTVSIQVKAIQSKRSVGWPIMRDNLADGIFYVFVNLNGMLNPEYFVAEAGEIKGLIKQYSRRGILQLSLLRDGRFLDRWDKLQDNKFSPKKKSDG